MCCRLPPVMAWYDGCESVHVGDFAADEPSEATEFFLEHLSVKAHEHSLQDTEDAGTIKYDNVVKAQTEDPSCDFLNDLFKYWNPTQDAPVDEQQMATSTATAAAAMDGLGGAVI